MLFRQKFTDHKHETHTAKVDWNVQSKS